MSKRAKLLDDTEVEKSWLVNVAATDGVVTISVISLTVRCLRSTVR